MHPVFRQFFQQLGIQEEAQLTQAAALFTTRRLEKGEMWLDEGQVCSHLALVCRGLLRLFYRLDGVEKIMLFFQAPSLASDYYSFLTQQPSIRLIEAVEPCELLCLHIEDRPKLLALPGWEAVGRRLTEYAYLHAVQRSNRLLHDDPETRYATLLREQPDLLQRVPQYMIASYLDMKPETLSRVKRRIQQQPDSAYRSVHNLLPGNPFS